MRSKQTRCKYFGSPWCTLRQFCGQPVPEVLRDEFDASINPDDVYSLYPAHWSDIDESLTEPGIVWGAAKAATVLQRRRAEGKLDPK